MCIIMYYMTVLKCKYSLSKIGSASNRFPSDVRIRLLLPELDLAGAKGVRGSGLAIWSYLEVERSSILNGKINFFDAMFKFANCKRLPEGTR